MVKYLTLRKGSDSHLTAPAIRGGYCTLWLQHLGEDRQLVSSVTGEAKESQQEHS